MDICQVCGSKESKPFLKVMDHAKEATFMLRKCDKCGLIFLHPIPTKKELERYYTNEYYQRPAKGIVGFLEKSLFDAIHSKHLKHIKNYIKRGKLLDIGCGNGYFLNFAKKKGLDTLGLEMSTQASVFARKRGLEIINKDITQIQIPKNSLDCITMFQVLEHMTSLDTTFKKIDTWLKKDGIFLIEIPNLDSLQFSILKQNWIHLDVPRHIFHFKRKAFRQLVNKNGFKIVDEYSVPFSHHAVGGWLNTISQIFRKKQVKKEKLSKAAPSGFNIKYFILLVVSHCVRIFPSVFNVRPATKAYILKKR
ncbi:MAG: class I SAM-dependent methyltransferase [Nanoarchaeota archaeon]|nr:class I SAM-dependent methyltransferase [Nanoarchaeota archaeon]